MFRLLIRMEWMKTCCRMNIIFSSIVCMLVFIQVAFLAKIDVGDNVTAAIIHSHAARYTSNLAFMFIPVLLLVNIAREFDYAVVQRSLVSGISRRGYFMGKLLQLGLFSVFAFVLAIIFSLLASAIYRTPVVWDFEKPAMFFIVAFCLGSFSLMLAFILKKRFYALAVFMGYALLENTLTAIMAGKTILLPFQTCIRLLRQGIYEWPEFIMAGTYTITFLAMAFQVFRRSDLR